MTDVGRANVRLFGELDLRIGEDRLPPLGSARAQSLLAYLLLNDDAPQARQRLAFLLWPDSSERQARTNLRHVLHTLRQNHPELDRFLEVTPQTLRWRKEAPNWLDVAAFDKALERAATPGAGPDEILAALREAVGYYTGDLLEGCYDEWVVEVRERLHDRYIEALRRLVGFLAERGDYGEAILLARDLLRRDRLSEETHRLLMRLHDAAGDRAGAIRAYHECVSTLHRELGVDPSAATGRAYERLMRTEESPAPEPETQAIPVADDLVGRDAEWKLLTECWKRSERGRAQLALVSGEPGVGKSRLVEELSAWCAHRGAAVAQARSYPTEGEIGYGVVIAWLRAPEIGSQIRAAGPADRMELARLLPELGDGSISDGRGRHEADQRRRLFDAFARTITGTPRPTLLVVDDAQWCDPHSLQAMHYLLRFAPGAPLLVVAAVRREEIEDDHPLESLVNDLRSIDGSTEIALDRLSRSATEQLARHLAGDELGQDSVDALYSETEGNPLFIVETIRAGWDGSGRATPTLTPKLQAVITARFRQLSDEARDLLGLAATVGRDFRAGTLAAASMLEDTSFIRSVDELWRRRIIREQGTDAYDFAHGRIRDVAYDTLSPAIRRRNHVAIAGALLELYAADVDAVSGEVATHYERAGEIDPAVEWYRRAAVQAQRLDATLEAVRFLEKARALVAALPEGSDRALRELGILTALATPLAVIDGFASARLEEAQQRALQLGRAAGIDPEPQLLRSIVMSRLCRRDFDAARSVTEQLRSTALEAGDQVLLSESGYLSGIAAFWGADLVAARTHFEQVVQQFRPERRMDHVLRFGHDPSVLCLSRLANTLWFLGDADGARRTRDEAMARAVEAGHVYSRGVASVFAGLLCLDLDEPSRFREFVDGLTSDLDGHAWHDSTSGAFRGFAEIIEGRPDEGIGRIRSVIENAPAVDQAPGQRALLMRLLVAAHDAAGQPEEGLGAANEALALTGSRIWEAEIRRLRADFLRRLGAGTDEVGEELDRAADVARRQGAVGPERKVAATRSLLR